MVHKKFTQRALLFVMLFLLSFTGFVPVFAEEKDNNINFNKIDEFINSRMKTKKIPGVSLAIVKGKKAIYLKGYGVDGKKQPVTPQTPFVLGSVSKSFTGLAIMQLAEKGKIDLDAPVVKYLSWFTTRNSETSDKITINQLLSHTSGFSTLDGREIMLKDNMPIEQLVRNLKNTKPGKANTFQYSNINYLILGEIIQAVSGVPYEQYIKENIFKPLDMKHSYTNQNDAFKNGFTNGYKSFFGLMLQTKQPDHEASIPFGYLISSSEDLANYLIAQINDGNYKNNSIISKEGMDQTHTPASLDSNYGMGWGIERTGYVFSHSGDTENFHSDVRVDKYEDLGIVMLFNSNDYVATSLSNSQIYSAIPSGVLDIVRGIEPVQNAKSNTFLIYLIIDAVVLIIILLLGIATFRLFGLKNRLKTGKSGLAANITTLIAINILLPLAIIVIFPVFLTNRYFISLRFFVTSIPGLGILLVLVLAVLFAMGIAKIIILGSFIKNSRNNKSINA